MNISIFRFSAHLHFSELKVEGDFYELPCWEEAYFVWMIAWGWEIHMGMMNPIVYYISCLKEAPIHPIFSFMDICFYMIAIWGCSPKAKLRMLEGQLGHLIDDMASFSWSILSCMDATEKLRGNKLVYPCTCLRTSNL